MRILDRLPVSLLLALLPYFIVADDYALPCAYYLDPTDTGTCNEPIAPITTITQSKSYVAKLPCLDCPVLEYLDDRHIEHHIIQSKNALFFNVTLSHDRTSLLLNQDPIFPSLVSTPSSEPPTIYIPQILPNFSRADLDTTLACKKDSCFDNFHGGCYCLEGRAVGGLRMDYDYSVRTIGRQPGNEVTWAVTFDAIGGKDGFLADPVWSFNRSDQQMLAITIQGTEIKAEKVEPDQQAASSLFGPFGEEQETKYSDLEIINVGFVKRSYSFPTPPPRTFWSSIKHFFGNDPAPPENHVVYLQEEWGDYGKKGTFRDEIGKIIHDWWWDLIAIVVGSVIAGLIGLYGIYRLFLMILEQRRLAKWGGMDEVWRQIRESGDEEERLLDGGYRDDPDGTPPPQYMDELPVNKPLPSKPLPDKPLPPVPLIEDI